jgi:hypothetical protein
MGKEYAEREYRPEELPKTYSERMKELRENRERYAFLHPERDDRHSKKRGEDRQRLDDKQDYTLVQPLYRTSFARFFEISSQAPGQSLSQPSAVENQLLHSTALEQKNTASPQEQSSTVSNSLAEPQQIAQTHQTNAVKPTKAGSQPSQQEWIANEDVILPARNSPLTQDSQHDQNRAIENVNEQQSWQPAPQVATANLTSGLLSGKSADGKRTDGPANQQIAGTSVRIFYIYPFQVQTIQPMGSIQDLEVAALQQAYKFQNAAFARHMVNLRYAQIQQNNEVLRQAEGSGDRDWAERTYGPSEAVGDFKSKTPLDKPHRSDKGRLVYNTTFDEDSVGYYNRHLLAEAEKWYVEQQKALARQQAMARSVSSEEVNAMVLESRQMIAESERLRREHQQVLDQLEKGKQPKQVAVPSQGRGQPQSTGQKPQALDPLTIQPGESIGSVPPGQYPYAQQSPQPTSQPQQYPGAVPLDLDNPMTVQVPAGQSLSGYAQGEKSSATTQQVAQSSPRSLSPTERVEQQVAQRAQQLLQANRDRITTEQNAYSNDQDPNSPRWQRLWQMADKRRAFAQKERTLQTERNRLSEEITHLDATPDENTGRMATAEDIQNSEKHKKLVKLTAQQKQVEAQIQQAKQMQVSLEYAFPALAAVDNEDGSKPGDLQAVLQRMPEKFGEIRSDIDKLSAQIQKDPSTATLFDSVVATHLQQWQQDKSISPEQRQQVMAWLKAQREDKDRNAAIALSEFRGGECDGAGISAVDCRK